ncbi:C3a anaphylatoxin chemotactic receptor-like [Engystomops pustulosus]|uniref:C3a anaphylatoxin chemotactic receptor-like n=1 Tax=Engystomops pustulosus TaxID=76066 RepID=UPI003AFA9329
MDLEDYFLDSPDKPGYREYDRRSFNEDFRTSLTDFQRMAYIITIINRVSITLYSIIFLLGIIGNGLVIWIAGFRMKKTISAVWFLHLAIANFLCCISIPLHIARWNYNVLLAIVILFYLNMTTSSFLLTAMMVDRWVSVMWPVWAKVHRTQKLVRITAGVIWLMSLAWIGFMYFLPLSVHSTYKLKLIIELIRFIIFFVIPFPIIVTSYVIIFLKRRQIKRPQRSQRPYRIITAVILSFFLCWAPYYIWPLIPLNHGGILQFQIVDTIIYTLAFFNSCIYPIIYVSMGQDSGQSFLRSIPLRIESALSEATDDLCQEQEDCGEAHADV